MRKLKAGSCSNKTSGAPRSAGRGLPSATPPFASVRGALAPSSSLLGAFEALLFDAVREVLAAMPVRTRAHCAALNTVWAALLREPQLHARLTLASRG
jgi:hypothetical protein